MIFTSADLYKTMGKDEVYRLRSKLELNGAPKKGMKMVISPVNGYLRSMNYWDFDEVEEFYRDRIANHPTAFKYKKHWKHTMLQLKVLREAMLCE